MNMQVLKPSRKKIVAGDIFALKVLKDRYHFGRVIRTDTKIGNGDDVILVYLYRATSPEKVMIPNLSRQDLLIPPIGTTRYPWSLGYFETVRSLLISHDDVLPVHCFSSPIDKKYFDEDARELDHRSEPCGLFGIAGYGAIDDKISDALGLPRSEESVAYDKQQGRRREKAKLRHERLMQEKSKRAKGR